MSLYYSGINPTVDICLFKMIDEKLNVLVIRRSSMSSACANLLAFPGGFIDTQAKKGNEFEFNLEAPLDAAIRELKEETSVEIDVLKKFIVKVGEYEGNKRDPRDNEKSWTKSYAFAINIDDLDLDFKVKAADDADEAFFCPVEFLQKTQMAFDHNKILNDALIKISLTMKPKSFV